MASYNQQSLTWDSYTKDLIQNSQCQVCLDTFDAPAKKIFQCQIGHLICEQCSQKIRLKPCPTCQSLPAKASRNLQLENQLENMPRKCKFLKEGCELMFSRRNIEEHEIYCPFQILFQPPKDVFHKVCEKGNLLMVKKCLLEHEQRKIDLNFRNDQKMTAFMVACLHDRHEIVKEILSDKYPEDLRESILRAKVPVNYKINIHTITKFCDFLSGFDLAVKSGHLKTVQTILESIGVNPRLTSVFQYDRYSHYTTNVHPFIMATFSQNFCKMVQCLETFGKLVLNPLDLMNHFHIILRRICEHFEEGRTARDAIDFLFNPIRFQPNFFMGGPPICTYACFNYVFFASCKKEKFETAYHLQSVLQHSCTLALKPEEVIDFIKKSPKPSSIKVKTIEFFYTNKYLGPKLSTDFFELGFIEACKWNRHQAVQKIIEFDKKPLKARSTQIHEVITELCERGHLKTLEVIFNALKEANMEMHHLSDELLKKTIQRNDDKMLRLLCSEENTQFKTLVPVFKTSGDGNCREKRKPFCDCTPEHLACAMGSLECVKILLQSFHIHDFVQNDDFCDSKTALDLAFQYGHFDCVKVILKEAIKEKAKIKVKEKTALANFGMVMEKRPDLSILIIQSGYIPLQNVIDGMKTDQNGTTQCSIDFLNGKRARLSFEITLEH